MHETNIQSSKYTIHSIPSEALQTKLTAIFDDFDMHAQLDGISKNDNIRKSCKNMEYAIAICTIIFSMFCVLSARAIEIQHSIHFPLESIDINTVSDERVHLIPNNLEAVSIANDIKFGVIKHYRVPSDRKRLTISAKIINHEQYVLTNKPFHIDSVYDKDNTLIIDYGEIPNVISEHPQVIVFNDHLVDDDIRVVDLFITPFTYDKTTQILSYTHDMLISISYSDCPDTDATDSKQEVIKSPFINVMDMIENHENFPAKANIVIENEPYQNFSVGYYYIITTNELKKSFQRLASWKEQNGFKVIISTIEELRSMEKYALSNTIVDDAARVRAFLKDEYLSHVSGGYGRNMFILLAGHHSLNFPIRYFSASDDNNYRGSDWLLTECYVPGDCYFADFVSEYPLQWDTRANSYVVKRGFNQYTQTVPIGRLICKSHEEVNNYTDKLIRYEINPGNGDNDYLNNMLFTCQYDMIASHYPEQILPSFSSFNTVIDMRDQCTHDTPQYLPKGADVVRAMNNCGFISLNGHGCPTGIALSGCDGYFGTYLKALEKYNYETGSLPWGLGDIGGGIDQLTNNSKPSVIFTTACAPMPFDTPILEEVNHDGIYYHHYDYPYNMGSSFTVGNKNGGVAFFGATRLLYRTNARLLHESFGETMKSDNTAGISLMNAKIQSATNCYEKAGFNLIGDPSFKIWRQQPNLKKYNVTKRGGVIVLQNCQNSVITLHNGTSSLTIKSNTNSISYSLPDNFKSGFLCWTIKADNTLPYAYLDMNSGSVRNQHLTYVVNGASIAEKGLFKITDNSVVDVHSISSVNIGHRLVMKDSYMNISSNEGVSLNGELTNSNVIIESPSIELCKELYIKKGCKVELKNINL